MAITKLTDTSGNKDNEYRTNDSNLNNPEKTDPPDNKTVPIPKYIGKSTNPYDVTHGGNVSSKPGTTVNVEGNAQPYFYIPQSMESM